MFIRSVTPGTLVGKDTVRTVLTLQRARKEDSGNYTCVVADIAEATVTVHILNGESAEMSTTRSCGNASAGGPSMRNLWANFGAANNIYISHTGLAGAEMDRKVLEGRVIFNGSRMKEPRNL